MQGLSIVQETYLIGLIARGDTHAQIKQEIVAKFDRTVTSDTIIAVKKRNKENLVMIRAKAMEIAEADTKAIKHRANNLLNKKLDSDEIGLELIAKAHQDYIEDIITLKDYMILVKSIKTASIQELVTISKEMHAQSSDAPAGVSNPEDMKRIREAIESGNDVTLNQIIFKGNDGQRMAPGSEHIPAV